MFLLLYWKDTEVGRSLSATRFYATRENLAVAKEDAKCQRSSGLVKFCSRGGNIFGTTTLYSTYSTLYEYSNNVIPLHSLLVQYFVPGSQH
jgi:hypothetical protein